MATEFFDAQSLKRLRNRNYKKRFRMNLIILASQQGTRFPPYTNDKPKCLVEFNGKSLLDH